MKQPIHDKPREFNLEVLHEEDEEEKLNRKKTNK